MVWEATRHKEAALRRRFHRRELPLFWADAKECRTEQPAYGKLRFAELRVVVKNRASFPSVTG
jgi:hypothetical protein